MSTSKKCSCCQQRKPLTEFGANLQTPDGLMYYCRECAKAKQRAFRKNNPVSASASRKRYLDKIRAKNLAARGGAEPQHHG